MLAVSSTLPFGQAEARETPTIVISAPEGFEYLDQDQTLFVDLFFGGQQIGETMVNLTPERVTFVDVDELIALLPTVTDQALVKASLEAQAIPTNAHLACSPKSNRSECGTLSPDIIGVIVDRDNFRVDIFLNPNLLEVQDELEGRYIPLPNRGISLINTIGGVVSGGSEGANAFNLQDRLILATGDKRLRADFTYSDQFNGGAERLSLEWDVPEKRYSAGALWAPGNAITGRRKLLGLGLETQIDTREDKDNILGSPVIVFLERRARIDLLRDGRILTSQVYDAGNQLLDTSSLPEGSYEIVLRIEEAGGAAREETRFFTKSRRIPAAGRYDFFIFGGLLASGYDPGSLDFSNDPYGQAGVAFRLSENWAIDGGAQVSDEQTSIEAGATYLSPIAQVRAAAIWADAGGRGAIFQVSSTGTRRFNFNFDFRRMRGYQSNRNEPTVSDPFGPVTYGAGLRRYALARNYTQFGGVVSYSTRSLRMLGTLFYQDEPGRAASYTVGPSLEWDVYRQKQVQVTLRTDLTASDSGASGFAGVSVRLTGKRATLSAKAGGRRSSIANDSVGDGMVAAVAGAWNSRVAGGEVALGAGYERQPSEHNFVLSSELRHPIGSISGDFVRTSRDSNDTTQYAVGFQTTLLAGQGELDIAGRTTTESMIVAQVIGASDNDRFELIVNEHVAGTILGKENLALALPAYRSYSVRMRPVGDDLLSYDGSSREIGLYPGAVEKLEWDVSPISIKFGHLVDGTGKGIPHASITGKGVWSETDDQGYFQIEVGDDTQVTVTMNNGKSFPLTLPSAPKGNSVAHLGDITCCELTTTQVAAFNFGSD